LVALLLIAAGCTDFDTGVDLRASSLWEATLAPAATPGSSLPRVTGQAAVVVRSGVSRVGLGLEGVDRDLHWGLFRQTCADPGARLLDAGAYPVIPAGAQELEVSLAVELMPDQGYHVRIGADEAIEVLVACGDLVLVESP
ncbi:MAG TPA: hypothetical protein VMM12_09215, partial [Longimicrobiales bacterium]|nr:hypothetical protein [Longimicrobiales bacterium]